MVQVFRSSILGLLGILMKLSIINICHFWKKQGQSPHHNPVTVFESILDWTNQRTKSQDFRKWPSAAMDMVYRWKSTVYHCLPGILQHWNNSACTNIIKYYDLARNLVQTYHMTAAHSGRVDKQHGDYRDRRHCLDRLYPAHSWAWKRNSWKKTYWRRAAPLQSPLATPKNAMRTIKPSQRKTGASHHTAHKTPVLFKEASL